MRSLFFFEEMYMSHLELRVLAKLKVNPEYRIDVIREFEILVIQSRKEDGCVQYDLHYDVNDINTLIFFEIWKSENEFEAHKKSNHFIVCFNKIEHMIENHHAYIMNSVS